MLLLGTRFEIFKCPQWGPGHDRVAGYGTSHTWNIASRFGGTGTVSSIPNPPFIRLSTDGHDLSFADALDDAGHLFVFPECCVRPVQATPFANNDGVSVSRQAPADNDWPSGYSPLVGAFGIVRRALDATWAEVDFVASSQARNVGLAYPDLPFKHQWLQREQGNVGTAVGPLTPNNTRVCPPYINLAVAPYLHFTVAPPPPSATPAKTPVKAPIFNLVVPPVKDFDGHCTPAEHPDFKGWCGRFRAHSNFCPHKKLLAAQAVKR